ncbi:hypothetical protein AC249_AIPGENE19758 [Exaiptasia diaphana]|nr:hypothetical protein AC249_AIPGENE19758 [Exaiptasia diaphana]
MNYESTPNSPQAKNIPRGSGVKSCYSLMLLPDHDRTTQAFPDIMHATKNAVLAIIDLITRREDTEKVRTTETALQKFIVNPNTVDDQTPTTSKDKSQKTKYILDVTTMGNIKAFGMDKITGPVSKLDPDTVTELFPQFDADCLQRKNTHVDVLLGCDYFGLHPKKEEAKS